MHFIIKIKKYNLFYKHIQLQNTIYFLNIYNLFLIFTHKYIYNTIKKYMYKAVYSFYIHTCKHLVTIGIRLVEKVCSDT